MKDGLDGLFTSTVGHVNTITAACINVGLARFVPGNPWLASTSTVIDQEVAGIPTRTDILPGPAIAGQPVDVVVGVRGNDATMVGSVDAAAVVPPVPAPAPPPSSSG